MASAQDIEFNIFLDPAMESQTGKVGVVEIDGVEWPCVCTGSEWEDGVGTLAFRVVGAGQEATR